MPKRGMARAIQKRTLETRARLVAAAEEVIDEVGYDGLRVDQVVKRAGVAKGTFFAHFHDKDALMDQLIGARLDAYLDTIEAMDAPTSVDEIVDAFDLIGTVRDDQISDFYEAFARRLADAETFAPIAAANQADVEAARARGRSTTRLVLSDKMRADMISGLRAWRDASSGRGSVLETVSHEGWRVDQVRSGLAQAVNQWRHAPAHPAVGTPEVIEPGFARLPGGWLRDLAAEHAPGNQPGVELLPKQPGAGHADEQGQQGV